MDHDFYSLKEAAKELDCEINTLLKWGADGKIGLCIYYKGYDFSSPPEIDQELGLSFRRRVEKFLTIAKEDIMRAYQEHNDLLNAKDVPNFNFVSLVDWKINFEVPSPFSSKSLFLTKETFATLKAEIQKRSAESITQKEDEKRILNLSDVIDQTATRPRKTKPDGTLTQAVRYLFDYLFANGEVENLKKANIHVFARKMKEFIKQPATTRDKKEMEILECLSERIERVLISGNSISIKTKDYQHPLKGGAFRPEKSSNYKKSDLEKRLKPLREGKGILD